MSNTPNKTKIEEILEKMNQYKEDIKKYLLEMTILQIRSKKKIYI